MLSDMNGDAGVTMMMRIRMRVLTQLLVDISQTKVSIGYL